jgi:hypothetical protein
MDVPERIAERPNEYEVLAAWHDERAMARRRFAGEHAMVAAAFVVIAIALREIEGAFQEHAE